MLLDLTIAPGTDLLLEIANVLTADALAEIGRLLPAVVFDDGRATAGVQARPVKDNRQMRTGSPEAERLQAIVRRALDASAMFYSATLPRHISPALVNEYQTGMSYGAHVDNAIMAAGTPLRSDVSLTLFLSPPDSYDGGELEMRDALHGYHRVKLVAGSAFIYPSTTLHQVTAVTRGVRHAAVFWVQSLVRGAEQRKLLFELDLAIIGLRKREPAAPELATLTAIYHNLVRLWAET